MRIIPEQLPKLEEVWRERCRELEQQLASTKLQCEVLANQNRIVREGADELRKQLSLSH